MRCFDYCEKSMGERTKPEKRKRDSYYWTKNKIKQLKVGRKKLAHYLSVYGQSLNLDLRCGSIPKMGQISKTIFYPLI